MKKVIILLSFISLIGCVGKEAIRTSTISGMVKNLGEDPVLLSIGRDIDTLSINTDGTFSFTKELEKPGSFYLRVARNSASIYLSPGSDLIVNFDVEDFDNSLTFDGDLAIESRYNIKYNALSKELSSGIRDLYAAEAQAYREGVASIRDAKDNMLDKYVQDNPDIHPRFVESQKIMIEFLYYSSLTTYEPAHKYYAKVEEVELPNDWFSFEEGIDINNSDYLETPVSMSIVGGIISKSIQEENSFLDDNSGGPAGLLGAQFDWILANVENQEVIDYFLNTNLLSIVDYTGPAGIEEYIDIFFEKTTNQQNKDQLKEKIALWAPLNIGNDAPAFELPDIDGNLVSLSDFQGKYVYIDFWATWCGPCKVEIPFLIEMEENFKDRNLKIVSISVDQDKQAWIDMVTEDKPKWLQLHDGINMNDDYLVRFIPTFVLLDRDGKILNARAPRPSSGEVLTDLFNSLEGL